MAGHLTCSMETSSFVCLSIQKSPPVQNRAEGHHCESGGRLSFYCLSYTAVLLTFLPAESVPLVLTVRVLPSADTTIRPVVTTLPSFLPVNPNVRSSIFLYDLSSVFGSPVTG